MENLNFKNLYDLEEFLQYKELLGQGAEGVCFKIGDYTLKIYKHLLETRKTQTKEDNERLYNYFLKFKDVEIDNFTFVKNIATMENGNIIGTISKYVKGTSLDLLKLHNLPIEDILKAIEQLIPNIKRLSAEYNIKVEDVFMTNIIYEQNKIYFIDTSSYSFDEEEPYYIYKYNMIHIMKELMRCVTNSYHDYTLIEFLNKFNSECNYIEEEELLLNPIKLLKQIKKAIEEFCDTEIMSFSDSVPIINQKIRKHLVVKTLRL